MAVETRAQHNSESEPKTGFIRAYYGWYEKDMHGAVHFIAQWYVQRTTWEEALADLPSLRKKLGISKPSFITRLFPFLKPKEVKYYYWIGREGRPAHPNFW